MTSAKRAGATRRYVGQYRWMDASKADDEFAGALIQYAAGGQGNHTINEHRQTAASRCQQESLLCREIGVLTFGSYLVQNCAGAEFDQLRTTS